MDEFRTFLKGNGDTIPNFKSHLDAKSYLEEKYKDQLVFHKQIVDNGVTSYLYHLIFDNDAYYKGLEKLNGGKWSLVDDDCYNFLFSYKRIEVFNDGKISFI